MSKGGLARLLGLFTLATSCERGSPSPSSADASASDGRRTTFDANTETETSSPDAGPLASDAATAASSGLPAIPPKIKSAVDASAPRDASLSEPNSAARNSDGGLRRDSGGGAKAPTISEVTVDGGVVEEVDASIASSVEPPRLLDWQLLEFPDAPLARKLLLSTNMPTTVRVAVFGGDSVWTRDFESAATEHALPLLGFEPSTDYVVSVTLFGEAEQVANEMELELSTSPLPDDWPPIRIILAESERMEPGYTMFSARPDLDGTPYTVIVDARGDVVWFTKLGTSDLRQLPNGDFAFVGNDQIQVMNPFAEVMERFHGRSTTMPVEGSVAVATERFHHEVFLMETGSFLSLSKERRWVDDYPTSETDPLAPTESRYEDYDVVVEFDRPTGAIVHEWCLYDVLDPRRIGYDSLRGWGHANAVLHHPPDDSYIVSVRHQDAVVKFSRSSGEVRWILGPHANWNEPFLPFLLTPVGASFTWPYHQHAPMLTSSGTLLLFDNGNHRASPPEEKVPPEENHSRVVEFDIDERTMEVSTVWEYGAEAEPRLFADYVGDVDELLNTGNVLITFGGVTHVDGVPVDSEPNARHQAVIVEVTRESPPRKVFELVVADEIDGAGGWNVYRSERIQSLYGDE